MILTFQMLNLDLGMDNKTQYTVYLHQHRDIYPECTEPYGQYNQRVAGPKNNGLIQERYYLIKATEMRGLPRDVLPCKAKNETEELGYEGGIGKCIYGELEKCTREKCQPFHLSFFCSDSIQEQMGCRLPWNKGNSSMTNCSTAEDLVKFYTLAEHMMYSGENRYYQMTGCEQPCDYYFYRAKQAIISIGWDRWSNTRVDMTWI